MSDTPRTDHVIQHGAAYTSISEVVFVSRTLERELTAAQARIAELEAQAKADAEDAAKTLALLKEMRGSVEDWAAYAGDYFREKHKLQEELDGYDAAIRKHEAAIDAARERGNG